MKKIYFLALLLLATSFTFAQRPEGGIRKEGQRQFSAEQMAQRNTERMKRTLNLTDAQVASVDSINLVYAKAQAALFQSGKENREQNREAMKALGTQKREAISAVLTTEQMDSYKQQMNKMSERGNREGSNRKSSGKQFKQHKQKAE